MDNATRRQLLNRHRSSGFPGSIIDVFKAYDQGIDLIGQYEQQMQVANTPQEQQQGLRPQHQAGNTNASMAFPNQPPNASFNTVGMKAPIDMKQFDDRGNLVMSYDKVPPGITDLKMSSQGGTVIETPAKMQSGGRRLKREALNMFPALEALGNVKVKTDRDFTQEKTGMGDIEYFAPGQKVITYPTGERVKHPGSDRRHTVLVNPDTNDAQSVALDMLHGLAAEDSTYGRLVDEFSEALGENEAKYFYELDRKEGLAEDGYDQWHQNYIDGKLRNLLFQGTEEDFKTSRYNPEERAQIQRYNPIAYDKFLEIESYLKSPKKIQKNGGVKKYQTAGELTLGQTSPDWRATGPGLRIDGQTYQNSQLTGATRVPINPETGDQLPIMLPAAEVVGRRDYNDSITEAVSRTNSGLLGSQTSAKDYAQMRDAVRSGMNTAGNNMLAAAGDVLSSSQRYAVNAPLAYAMGKTPNLSMFPSADRNLGINQPNAFPSETLGVTNPIGAFAVDALTDPIAIAGIGALGRAGISRARGLLRNAAGDVNQNLLSRSLPPIIEQTPQRQVARSQEWMQNWFNNPETQRRINRLVPENAQMSTGTQSVRGHMKGFEHDVTLIDDKTRGLLNAENTKMGRSNPGYSSVHYPQHRSEGSVAFPNQTVLDPKQINNLENTTIHELTHSVAPSEFINAATTSTTLGRTSTSPGVKGTDIFRRHLTPQAKSAENLYQQGIQKTGWGDAGYMSDPTEQHARIMQLRHMGNLKPGQQVTASTIENLRNQNLRALGSEKYVVEDEFFDIYKSPARMADMFNTLPGLAPIAGGSLATGAGIGLLNNNNAVSPQMKNGGVRKYQTGGQADTLYVNTPDHPRIQQYADSAYAYNMGLEGQAKAIAESQKLLDEYNNRNKFTGSHKAFGQTSSINTDTSNTIKGLQPSSTQKINYMAPAPYDPSINVPVKIPVPGPNNFQSGIVYSLWDKPKQPVVYRPELQQMNRINPSAISQSTPNASLKPVGKYINNTRPPQTMYRQDPSVSTGQYPIGEYLWDSNKKRWKTDTWDQEMQKSSRELAIPRGYKLGGMRRK